MQSLETHLKELKAYVTSGISDPALLKHLYIEGFWQVSELAYVLLAILYASFNLPFPEYPFKFTSAGALLLNAKAAFPWQGLPYPKEHAEVAFFLEQLGLKESAKKMANWQKNTLDHEGRPILSFFSQEKLKLKSTDFTGVPTLFDYLEIDSTLSPTVYDEELGIVGKRNSETTVLSISSGCKSGMGVYLYKNSGIINFGPQIAPIGDCESFGLAGRSQNFQAKEDEDGYTVSYFNRLSAPCPKQTEILSDSAFSGYWIHAEESYNFSKGRFIKCVIEGSKPLKGLHFVFFAKAKACFVAGTHKLNPKSLDRYQGPATRVCFQGDDERIFINPLNEDERMEVIPLAGDESFWGANFLVSYSMNTPHQDYHLYTD